MTPFHRHPPKPVSWKTPVLLALIALAALWPAVLPVQAAQSPARPPALNTARGNTLTVTWLETGASLAVVLETPAGRLYLVDTGGIRKASGSTPDYNAGRDTIDPFLKSHGHAKIDAILVSHTHDDHFSGACWLIEHWKIGQFIDHGYPDKARGMPRTYLPLREAAKAGGIYRTVHAGDTLDWDAALRVEVLAPAADVFDKPDDGSHSFLNMSSIVLRVQHGRNVFLFPGDAYHAAKYIPPAKLKCTVLTSPHHGFHPDSSSFTKLAAPKAVVVTCATDYPGNANTPYPRSPGKFSIEKYGALGIETYVTAFDGAITARSDGAAVTFTRQRTRVIPPTPDSAAP